MPFLGDLTLDFCDAETKAVSREEIVRAARTQPRDKDDWYLTLTRANEEYMDVTMEDDAAFSIRCFEEGRNFSSAAALDEDLLESLVVSFYEHDGAWKRLCPWKEVPEKRRFSLRDLFR